MKINETDLNTTNKWTEIKRDKYVLHLEKN